MKENNFINNNGINAYFYTSFLDFWFRNYWDDWQLPLPRPIYGEVRLERLNDSIIPWVQFDWHPAKEPYDIPTPEL